MHGFTFLSGKGEHGGELRFDEETIDPVINPGRVTIGPFSVCISPCLAKEELKVIDFLGDDRGNVNFFVVVVAEETSTPFRCNFCCC
mmetsp:Transcript_55083/g.61533  ORF Transcript_55083/g.61533 Transcript_55083/m.61533 type:complete len:87 (-) Transcript_55083:954-1214(-)